MKLLIANHHLERLAGSELHTLDLCRGFRRAGHEVVAFTLKAGPVADILKGEGFPVFSLGNLDKLSAESLDLIYLHHSTCEALLGIIFAGRVPIVRGYLGHTHPLEKPVAGDLVNATVYKSEEDRKALGARPGVPSLIAYNVYDDQRVALGEALEESRSNKCNFAVVSNHLDADLKELLGTLVEEGLCSFTHFGRPHNSVLLTADHLRPFDAVISIGRTVLLAAAMGKPVYVCDHFGADGWLTRKNFHRSRRHGFSGRLVANRDWSFVRRELLDTARWPTANDLAWLCKQVAQDHALSRRIEQLEVFFAGLIEESSALTVTPEGYLGVIQFIKEMDNLAGAQARRIEAQAEHLNRLNVRVRKLDQQLWYVRRSRMWKLLRLLGSFQARASSKPRRS